MMNHLWKIALTCNLDNPGLSGAPNRVMNFVECGNIRDFMVIATMKCWEERNTNTFPPIILKDTITTIHHNSLHTKTK